MAKTESIGSFSEREASVVAGAIKLDLGINARSERFYVNREPTVHWHVHVPARDLKLVQAWLKGYRTGRTCESIERNPANACLWPEFASLYPEAAS